MNYHEIELEEKTKQLLNASSEVEWRLTDLAKVWFTSKQAKPVIHERAAIFAATHSLRMQVGDFGRKVTFCAANVE
jgi:hypothetical protein